MDLSETFWMTLMATGVGVIGLIIKKMSQQSAMKFLFAVSIFTDELI